jgi:hypothetical protein
MILVAAVVEADEEDVPTRAGNSSVNEAPDILSLLFLFSSSPPPSPLTSSYVLFKPAEH